MNTQTVLGLLVRHALTALAGSLVYKGVLDANDVEPVVGASLAIGTVAWSYAQKRSAFLRSF